ncbi:MAG: phosphopantetheine-binding protein, partial [Tistlia sp.]
MPVLLNIVAEATGYPAAFLEPGMDLEADLGVDSIKRVEILAAVRRALGAAGEAAGPLPKAALGGARSLRALADILVHHVAGPAAGPAPAESPVSAPGQGAADAPGDLEALSAMLTGIVADKTGYPADMLAPELDIEADLGIDSIKRVEILAALRHALERESVDWPDQRALAGARTLGSVARLLAGAAASVASEAITGAAAPANQNDTAQNDTAQNDRPNDRAPNDRAPNDRAKVVAPPRHVATGRLLWSDLPQACPGRALPGGTLVLYDGGGRLAAELAQLLEQAGATVVVLQACTLPESVAVELPETIHRLPLAEAGRATLEAALARIERLFPPIAGAIFCWPETT